MKFLSFFIISILFFSCAVEKNKPYGSYDNFPEEKELTAHVVELDSAMFRYPFRVKIEKDKVVLMDLHNWDNYFHVYSYPECKYVASFGKRGEAPNEMLSAENIRIDGSFAWVLDANRSKLYQYSLEDTVSRVKEVMLDKDIIRALDFVLYEDSSFIIPDYTGESRICIVDVDGKVRKRIGKIPTIHPVDKSSLVALAQAWRSFIDYNPKSQVLAMVTQLGEILEIYNLKDSTHIIKAGPMGEPEYGVSQGNAVPTGIMGFSDVQVTDKYIYAVFHGRTFKEIARTQGELVDGGELVYVFDLKGNPVRKYHLDRRIYGIWVDEEKGKIIATDVNYNQPLAEFSM